jgi:hypothetical protein
VQDFFILQIMAMRICLLCLSLFVSACGQDSEQSDQIRNQLEGRWITTKAYRQGKNTRLLNDFYLNFSNEEVELNLPREIRVPWDLEMDTLLLTDHPFEKLILHDLTDSTLKISFDFNQHLYWVVLEKELQID